MKKFFRLLFAALVLAASISALAQGASSQEDAHSHYLKGLQYLEGKVVPRDDQVAIALFLKAAEMGHAQAQFQLGRLFVIGQGVPKDDRQAVTWLQKAAAQGVASSQTLLGTMYASGRGVPKDEQLAAAWYRQAAEQGDAYAQYLLGGMYAFGMGVPKNHETAYFWLLLASANDFENASKIRDLIEQKLLPEQKAAAQTAAREWQPRMPQSNPAVEQSSMKYDGSAQKSKSKYLAAPKADNSGSGIRIAKDLIAANNHVVAGCGQLKVNGEAAKLISSDPGNDLALIKTTEAGPTVKLRTQRLEQGEPVAVAGYPLRGLLTGFSMTTGNLNGLSGIRGDTRHIQISAPVQQGNSGGPVLDKSGNLIGMVVSKVDAIKVAQKTGDIPQNVNFALHVSVLRTFLEANSIDYDSAISNKPITTAAVAEQAKGYTVLVECWK